MVPMRCGPLTLRAGVVSPLVLGLSLADVPAALAQAPPPVARAEDLPVQPQAQLAVEAPRRPRRAPLDPATRELRQARGILAGGVVLTALCGVGLGALTYAAVAAGDRWTDRQQGGAITAGVALASCTLIAIAGIGVGASRVRALRSAGRVAWTGGLGLRF
jgi:hypothetical protein